jgi:uncharacterized protein YgiM (DUF1202 family)
MKKMTIIDFVEKYTHEYSDLTFLREKVDGVWTETSFRATREEAYKIGAGLMQLGLKKGDKVEILETKTVGSNVWGRFEKGWICLTGYVDLETVTENQGGNTEPEKPVEPQPPVEPEPPVTVTITYATIINTDAQNVRSAPDGTVVGTLKRGAKVEILEQKTVNGRLWGRYEGGWICMRSNVKLETVTEEIQGGNTEPEKPVEPQPPVEPEPPEVVTKTFGTVTYSYLRIRAGAGTNFASLGQLKKGERVEILETKTAGGVRWGRFEKGWICLTGYVELETVKVEQPKEETGIITADVLNVRTGAGTNYSVTCQLVQGTKVVILEKKTVNGTVWGRIEQGWISMDYVD